MHETKLQIYKRGYQYKFNRYSLGCLAFCKNWVKIRIT